MKLNRLFEIVYILLNKTQVTAKELAERFEVSQRTIYRDIDTLSECGIPVYAIKGKGGGISLVDGYKMDRAMLTVDEQKEILSALQSIKAADIQTENNALNKLSTFFNASNTNWIEIDFSHFSANTNWKNNFENIKHSIVNTKKIKIEYASLKGETSTRIVEPIKLLFKGISWYLDGYCSSKNDYRMFKLNRIISLEMLSETFALRKRAQTPNNHSRPMEHDEELVLVIGKEYAYMVFDDFDMQSISQNKNGDYIVRTKTYEKDWIINYILSFGDKVECVEPIKIRQEIKKIIERTAKRYL